MFLAQTTAFGLFKNVALVPILFTIRAKSECRSPSRKGGGFIETHLRSQRDDMRAKHADRNRALELRKRGLSYSEIQEVVPVSQASLSVWLRGVSLSPAQVQRLTEKKRAGNRSAAEKVRAMRLERIRRITDEAEREAYLCLQQHDQFWAIGVALYWAEGNKPKAWRSTEGFAFTNMDPAMILLIRRWLLRYCGVSAADLTYALYIHDSANICLAQRFWAGRLGIPPTSIRTYLKKPNPLTRRHNLGTHYYGTIRLSVRRSTALTHRVVAWIRATGVFCGVG